MSYPASISEATVSDSVKQLSCLTSCQRSCEQQLKQELVLLHHPAAGFSGQLHKLRQAFPSSRDRACLHSSILAFWASGSWGQPLCAPVPQLTQLACTQPAHRACGEALVCPLHHSKESILKALNTAEVAVRCWASHFPSFSPSEMIIFCSGKNTEGGFKRQYPFPKASHNNKKLRHPKCIEPNVRGFPDNCTSSFSSIRGERLTQIKSRIHIWFCLYQQTKIQTQFITAVNCRSCTDFKLDAKLNA